MQRLEMNAIHENNLDLFLKKLGIDEKFRNGELRCAVCGGVIRIDNLGAILSSKGEVSLVCNKAECYGKISPKILHQ